LQAVDTDAGTVTILGKTIYVDNSTLMMDKSDYAIRYFNLTDLDPNNADYLEIHAYKDVTTGNLVATRVERESYSSQSKVMGTVDAIGNLVVAGVAVDVSNAGTIPTLSVGQTVLVTGTYSNDMLLATQVSVIQTSAGELGHEVS
jgi:hypothetical protein